MELIIYSERLKMAACCKKYFPFMLKKNYHSLPHIEGHLHALEKDPSLYGWGPWLIIRENKRDIIGDIGFKGKPDSSSTVEVGYGIQKDEQGKGYATEALRALMKWTFRHKSVSTITAQCRQDNYASIRVLEKVKMLPVKEELQMIYWQAARPALND